MHCCLFAGLERLPIPVFFFLGGPASPLLLPGSGLVFSHTTDRTQCRALRSTKNLLSWSLTSTMLGELLLESDISPLGKRSNAVDNEHAPLAALSTSAYPTPGPVCLGCCTTPAKTPGAHYLALIRKRDTLLLDGALTDRSYTGDLKSNYALDLKEPTPRPKMTGHYCRLWRFPTERICTILNLVYLSYGNCLLI